MSGPDQPRGGPLDLRARLDGLPEHEQHAILVDTVRAAIGAVLRSVRPETIDPDRAVQELLGFDSLAAVEMSNQLKSATALMLSPTVMFDYPQPAALAEYLHGELVGRRPAGPAPAEKDLADMDLDELVNTALLSDDT
jgi:polyketide synthase 12